MHLRTTPGGGSFGNVVGVRDVGDKNSHQEGVGCIPPKDGLQDDREATSERGGKSVAIPPNGGRDGGGSPAGGGDLRLPPPEHGRTVHCKQAHYGTLSGGREKTRAKCIQLVVGTGHVGCGRDAYGESGGVTDVGGGGDRQDRDGDRLNWW